MKKVLFFGDPGIDDSFAIMYGLLHPEIEIVGIVTGYGNVEQIHAAHNAAYILQLADRIDIPVISGATMPFTDELTVYYPEIHGPEGLGPINVPENVLSIPIYNFGSIASILVTYGKDLVIIDVGRSTSLAIAFNLWNDMMQNIQEVYFMGGVFLEPGNVTPLAEANVYGDPLASRIVIHQARNLTIFPLNVTKKAVLTPNVMDYILANTSNPFQSIMKPMYDYYLSAYKTLNPAIEGPLLHDVLAISALVNPTFFKYVYRKVTVDTIGETKGQTFADFRPNTQSEGIQIVLELDEEKFIQDFIKIML
ncbi:nucleoside hydrolase [Bacillus clarus]|uniref:Nucleoside hydrolase n=1 Tax=Bacillus clarus TaxID=2338372 RepID=A0A090Z597_9BACI|nr:nucleoside hydrolase [Bacillus clarus]KFM99535.1 inosine-uridine preferring nucleoside hydrolase family protein [Bacillus clarus]RFT62433.1 nucleoside hydrolase [Bacillus clarus]